MDFYQSYRALSYLRSYSDPTHNIGISKGDSLLRLYNTNLVQNTISNKKKNYICKKSNSCKYNKRGHCCNKMAPISEKRSPAIKENTKENISVPSTGKNPSQNGRGIGPEILDFRESWLQDMEIYKDHVKSPQSLLTTHNHLHTVDGCLTSPTNKQIESSKRRARTKSDSDSDARLKNYHDQEDGLVFKRAREDNTDFKINTTVNVLVDEIKKDYMSSQIPHHSPNSKNVTVPTITSNQITNGSSNNNTKLQQGIPNDTSHSNFINHQHQHKNLHHLLSNGQPNDTGTSSSMMNNIIVNPYHLSLINTQEADKNKIVINSVKNNNVLLQNTQNSVGHCENHGKPTINKSHLANNSSMKCKSPIRNNKPKNITNTGTNNNKQKNNNSNSVGSTNSNNGGIASSIAPTYAVALNDISNITGNVSAGISNSIGNTTANTIAGEDFLFEQDKINISTIVLPSINTETRVDVPENNDDDDNDSYYDDDEFVGVIDTAEDYGDSSDESDDDYIGCTYYLNSDEENLGRILDNQSPFKLFQKRTPSAASINALINTRDKTDSESENKKDDIANSNLDTNLLLQEPSPHVATPSEYFTPKSLLTPSLFPLVPPYLAFSSHIEKGPPVPPELQKILKWRLSAVMPKVVRRVVANSGFRLIKKTNDWMASWEKHMKSPCFRAIKSHQKFNHLPGTFKIGRKDSVWRNIKQFITKFGKKEFGFMQKSFVLPQDLDALKKSWPKHAKKETKWIVKPPASARGTGIKVVSRWTEFPKQKPLIVQKYIERPLLINGNKFDLRLYVIITSINPLRIFMHTDGLARFASVQYRDDLLSLKDRCMHLTNYSINKFSSNYAKNEDHNACQGHKWTLKSLWNYFRERGINTTKLWGALRNLVIKTVIGGEGCLNRLYKTNVNSRYNCYELFGFDVLLDENLIPWLLEVNISPSLHSDLPLDQHVKGPLIQAVLNSALYQIPPKLTQQHENLIKAKYNIKGPLCHDKRIFTTCLTQDEVRKHNHYTSRNIEYREEYLETILDELTPDDVRCLIITEDEFAQSKPLERIFPTIKSFEFLKFLEGPRYYNRLLDAWETKFNGTKKKEGIKLLADLCEQGYHLQVPDAAFTKEPSSDVDIFELNALYKMQMKSSSKPGSPSPASDSIQMNGKKENTSDPKAVNDFQEEAKPIKNENIDSCNSIEGKV